jgi:hypothetical protein
MFGDAMLEEHEEGMFPVHAAFKNGDIIFWRKS